MLPTELTDVACFCLEYMPFHGITYVANIFFLIKSGVNWKSIFLKFQQVKCLERDEMSNPNLFKSI